MLWTKRVTLVVLLACVCFAPCLSRHKNKWDKKPSKMKALKNIAIATRKIFDKYKVGAVYCNFVCNELSVLCVPPWMDPSHESNHCMDPKTAVSCALCLKPATATSSAALDIELAHPSHPWATEPPAIAILPAIFGFGLEFCMLHCNHFINVCLPDWLDPFDMFNHCDIRRSIGSSSWDCISCLQSHMFIPQTSSSPGTTHTQSPDTILPPESTTVDPRDTHPTTTLPTGSCVPECYCRREIIIRMETTVDTCAGQRCKDDVPKNVVQASDDTWCGCDVKPACERTTTTQNATAVKPKWDPWDPWQHV